MNVTIPHDFTPRRYQRRFMGYLDQGGKRAVWVVHRRGGKDLTALHQECKASFRRRGAYWHIFPTESQGRKAIWEGFTKDGKRIMECVFPKEIRKSPKAFLPSSEMIVELKNGSIWRLMGSDKMEVVGAGPVGVVFSEFALAKPSTWNMVRPMLRENDGWAAFISTPRGRNHLWKLLEVAKQDKRWFWDVKTLFDTRAYDPEATLAEERASGMPEALIQQEYMCSFDAALVGSVWGDLIEQLGTRASQDFEHDKSNVFTTWDVGVDDSTAIWFWQYRPHGIQFIDFYEASGKPSSHYFGVLEQKGYQYRQHWLPHDAKQRSFQTGVSTIDQFRQELGSGRIGLVPQLSIADGIQAFRWLLQQPDTRFHGRCSDGLEALRAYHYAYSEERKTLASTPFHDWSSHAADAARYSGVVAKVSEVLLPAPEQKPMPIESEPLTLDSLWAEHEKRISRGRR